MYFRYRIIVLFIALSSLSYGQESLNERIIEHLIEDLVEELGEEYDYGQLNERLTFFSEFKIDLNETDGEELKDLPFLSPFQIENILKYRKTAGRFLSTYELQSIDGFDFPTIDRLLPFIKVNGPGHFEDLDIKNAVKEGKHDIMLRYGRALQLSEGYRRRDESDRSRYLGNPDRYFIRYRYELPKRFQLSVNMKKDAGEQFFKGAQKHGFDFYSASLFLKDIGPVKGIVIGDYSLQLGQGLNLWSGLSFGKGILLQNVPRQGVGIRPYTSSNEFLFLRGFAGTFQARNIEVTPFISYKKVDASIDEKDDTFSSLNFSGYHRTQTENKNRRSVNQLLYGLDLKFRFDKLNVGINAHQIKFNKRMVPAPLLYNEFDFSEKQLSSGSIYYDYTVLGTYLFGELASNLPGGWANVVGLISNISHDLSLILLHRSFKKDYFSFYNQAFAENRDAKNERGFYSGLQWTPHPKVAWVFYADYFRFPWLKFRVDAPSYGYDVFSNLKYHINKSNEVSIRFRIRKKQENSTIDHPVNVLTEVYKRQVRAEVRLRENRELRLRSRFEFVNYKKGIEKNENGYMAYQDVIYRPLSSPFSANVRLALFNTASYDSRIYAYESDVLYSYSLPAYANKGMRIYCNLKYKMSRRIDLWLRYASFLYNEDEIGSGLDRINGRMKSDIRLQLRLQV